MRSADIRIGERYGTVEVDGVPPRLVVPIDSRRFAGVRGYGRTDGPVLEDGTQAHDGVRVAEEPYDHPSSHRVAVAVLDRETGERQHVDFVQPRTIAGPYDTVRAEYDERERERAEHRAKRRAEQQQRRDRFAAATEALAALGISGKRVWCGAADTVSMPLDTFERLLGIEREP